MTPCYYCEADDDTCKTCIHSGTYIDPQEEITKLREQLAAKDVVIEKLTKRLASTNIIIEVVCAIHPDFACAKYELAENMNALSTHTDSTQILDEVRRAERERVAQYVQQGTGDWMLGKKIAEAIRSME